MAEPGGEDHELLYTGPIRDKSETIYHGIVVTSGLDCNFKSNK